jgi:uncharacterized protein (DUF885 family)
VQLKFYLRAVANAILDQGVHVDNWSKEQAMDLMVNKTFQQEREADGKWKRAQLTSDAAGRRTSSARRSTSTCARRWRRSSARASALKAYHDKVLSYGAPPVRFVRQLMLDEPIS